MKLSLIVVFTQLLCLTFLFEARSESLENWETKSTYGVKKELLDSLYNIKAFGAVAGGETLNTKCIQEAIDKAFYSGGGVVYVPEGIYLTGTIQLKSNVELFLHKEATLLGTGDTSSVNYPQIKPGYKSFVTRPDRYPEKVLIYAKGESNVTISGAGTIDGNGHHPDLFLNGAQKNRRKAINLIRFISCNNVRVKGAGSEEMLLITNSGHWALQPMNCDSVLIKYVRIEEYGGITPDGLPISDCRDVLVEDCYVSSDDDALGLKNGSPDILVENITIKRTVLESANSGFKCGSPQSFGRFNNVKFMGCTFRTVPPKLNERKSGFYHGFFLGLLNGDKGYFDNVLIEDCIIEGTQQPFAMYIGRLLNPYNSTWWTEAPKPENYGKLKNVCIRNIYYKYPVEPLPDVTDLDEIVLPVVIDGREESKIENLILENIYLPFPGGQKTTPEIPEDKKHSYPNVGRIYPRIPSYGLFLRHVNNCSINNLWMWTDRPDVRPALWISDVSNFEQNDVHQGMKPSNYLPAVYFENIEDGSMLSGQYENEIIASARDYDGSIKYVALYANGELLGKQTEAPYKWSLKGRGEFLLKLVAEDNQGDMSLRDITVSIHP